MPLSIYPVLLKANLIFKAFSRQSCTFKYFSNLRDPCDISIHASSLEFVADSILIENGLRRANFFQCPLPLLRRY